VSAAVHFEEWVSQYQDLYLHITILLEFSSRPYDTSSISEWIR